MPKKNMNHKESNGKKRKRRKLKRGIMLTFQIIIFVTLLAITIGIFYFYITYGKTILTLQSEARDKVSASTDETFRLAQTSLVYDSEGKQISTLKSEKDVYYIKYEEIPDAVVDAMLVSEDRNFFEHNGVDYLANVRAAIALIKHKGEITQGASTITQQLARNVFLTFNVTYRRKIAEIFYAQELEKKYSKADIMEFYLNGIYFANGHYGIQAAAKAYFGEGVKSLTLSQQIFLCSIPNNPNLYNPLTHMDNTLKRRDRILLQMYQQGKISKEDYDKAVKEMIFLKKDNKDQKNYVETYIYYCAVRALMKANGFEFRNQFSSEQDQEAYEKDYEELYNNYQKELYLKGYRIYTSIELDKQDLLQNAVDNALKGFTSVNKDGIYEMQGAAVCIDNDTGRVVAIVGGRNQNLGIYTLNRAYQSYRQPGSSIKPLIVYTPSFERNYYPATFVVDEYKKDGPKNADSTYAGKIRLQRAIELSKNTIAWKLFGELTPKVGLSYLLDMNFSKITDRDFTLAAALGGLTKGVSPVEMAAGYATLENDGRYREPTCIVMITDSEGKVIVNDNIDEKQIYQTNAARTMTETLTGVIKNGTARGLGLRNTISAGKTGTTNDKKDGWFVGYTPYYTTSVWVGYDIPRTVSNLMGATYPGTIWHDFMNQIHTSSMKQKFEFYDWRTIYQKKQEEANSDKEQTSNTDQQETPDTDGQQNNPITDGSQQDGTGQETGDSTNNDSENVEDNTQDENVTEDTQQNVIDDTPDTTQDDTTDQNTDTEDTGTQDGEPSN